MDTLLSWLVLRMQWLYGFVTNTLGLPVVVGYIALALAIGAFFYSLAHLYKNRYKGSAAALWLAVVILIPLGGVIYAALGQRMVNATPDPRPKKFYPSAPMPNRVIPTTLGSILGFIAMVAGAIAVAVFILIAVAYIQCMNDPKCM
jgi:hypothetical protein